MFDEAKYVAVYGILMLCLIVELLIGIGRSPFGALSGAAILAIAALQAVLIFLVYMHGRYGARPVADFAVISLVTIVPLFIPLQYSLVMSHHVCLPEEMMPREEHRFSKMAADGVRPGSWE